MKKNIKIAIVTCDNDFRNTFTKVLEMLEIAYHYDSLPLEKDKLCFIINELSNICYLLYQNKYQYGSLRTVSGLNTGKDKDYIRIGEYLKIEPSQILINEEVDLYIEKQGDE